MRRKKQVIPPNHLPVLIIPGFMSSGLEIQESSIYPSWKGNRIWLNIQTLGFQSLHVGGPLRKNEERLTAAVSHAVGTIDEVDDDDNIHVGNGANSLKKDNGKIYDKGDQNELSSREMHVEYLKQVECKSRWVEHIKLEPDMVSEKNGVLVRPIPGTAGVDYLTPGALTESASYVFGPVLKLLKSVGYKEGIDLDAAPYDWRIPPCVLESRDGYFTATMQKIESLYNNTNGTPVVLLCHSMGCKTAHYLLNFVLKRQGAGQAWLDRYIHTYIPVGAPHIGAPKSVRAIMAGDKMGLDAFLDEQEGLVLGRSLGSGPWLFPEDTETEAYTDTSLPSTVPHPPIVTIRRESTLNITIPSQQLRLASLTHDRKTPPMKLRLVIEVGSLTLRSSFQPVTNGKSSSVFNIPEEKFVIACPPDVKQTSRLYKQFNLSLEEPGAGAPTKKRKGICTLDLCWPFRCAKCLIKWLLCLPCALVCKLSWTVARGAAAGAAAGATALGSIRVIGNSETVNLKSQLISSVETKEDDGENGNIGRGKVIGIQVKLEPKDKSSSIFSFFSSKGPPATVLIQFQWEMSPAGISLESGRSKGKNTVSLCHQSKSDIGYSPCSINRLLQMERLFNALSLLHERYGKDPIGPHTESASAPPPVKKVIAIYGINLPTEVGAIYRRNPSLRLSNLKEQQMFVLDKEASLSGKMHMSHQIERGLIHETKTTPQLITTSSDNEKRVQTIPCSGDGTVPYWSLQHCRSWQGKGVAKCQVTVHEIDSAEHRAILNDKRFHNYLLDILCYE